MYRDALRNGGERDLEFRALQGLHRVYMARKGSRVKGLGLYRGYIGFIPA